jgi:chemotaxis response regulator CheB
MRIMADNDVIGAVQAVRKLVESAAWRDLAVGVTFTFVDFESLSLLPTASDREVWQACQAADVVLITANRTGGAESLTEVISQLGDDNSLPVITIGDAKRAVRDRDYLEDCAFALLDLIENIEALRGAGRLFIP